MVSFVSGSICSFYIIIFHSHSHCHHNLSNNTFVFHSIIHPYFVSVRRSLIIMCIVVAFICSRNEFPPKLSQQRSLPAHRTTNAVDAGWADWLRRAQRASSFRNIKAIRSCARAFSLVCGFKILKISKTFSPMGGARRDEQKIPGAHIIS